jgi:hypothetical protein
MPRYLCLAMASLFVVFCLLMVVLPSPALADDGEMELYLAPPRSPTEVRVDFEIINLPDIDVPSKTFEVLAYMTLTWEDERVLAQLPRDTVEMTLMEDVAEGTIGLMWFPNIQFTNQYYPRETHQRMLTIKRSPTDSGQETALISYDERLLVTLQAVLDLKKFPFDTQDFKIGLKTFCLPDEDVVLTIGTIDFFEYESADEREAGLENSVFCDYERNRLPMEWQNETISSTYRHIQSKSFQYEYQCIEIVITAQRDASFYAWKILLPILLIVAISCVTFWMPGESIGTRMSVSLFGFLTAVTFSFYVNSYLPRMANLTFLDGAIAGAYVFIVSAVIINVTAHLLRKRQKGQLIYKIDRTCRWLFPLMFVTFCTVWILAIL